MPAILLDANVLVALGWPNHAASAVAHRWFRDNARAGWAVCTLTQLAFVRHSVNPRVVQTAATCLDAMRLLRSMSAAAGYTFWHEASVDANDETLWSRVVGHRQVTDAYLVSLAKHHGGRVVTFDRGLATLDPTRVVLLEHQ